ncbi:MAG TPA: ATP-binding protein, partial [Streptosporangiaceae bacterium]
PVPVPPSHPRAPGRAGWPLASYMDYGPLPDTVPTARARTKVVLREWGPRFDPVADDTLLVVTELVSNAVTASRALVAARPVRLWLRSNWARVLVLVGDESPAPPLLFAPGVDAEHGRGLSVVTKLSSGWGWYPATSYGLAKVVWAEWRLPSMTGQGPATGQPRLCGSAP